MFQYSYIIIEIYSFIENLLKYKKLIFTNNINYKYKRKKFISLKIS